MLQFSAKDPDDIDDFTLQWSAVLGSETISAVAAAVASGTVTLGTPSISTTSTTVRVSGGTDGERAQVRQRITTSGGRQLDETMVFDVRAL